jgi:N utilization substance protein A
MDTELAIKLAAAGVRTRDDLGDLGVDELVEMASIDAARASTLIMAARAHWFSDAAGA